MNDFDELHALYHHGIKGQKWGVRRFQNEDGTLTAEGKKHYGITDNDIKAGKKYTGLVDKNCYRTPNSKNKDDVVSILKYDRCRGNNTSRYFNDYTSSKTTSIFSPAIQQIHHFTKNGKIALSYARVPGFGDIYVKGPGDFNDDDLKKWFKKVPNKDEILHTDFNENYLIHHGIKGQKWGVRRFQNEDGALTEEGARHYRVDDAKADVDKAKQEADKIKQANTLKDAKKDVKEHHLNFSFAKSTQENRARAEAAKVLIYEKYGKQTLKDYERDARKKKLIVAGAALLASAGIIASEAIAISNRLKRS